MWPYYLAGLLLLILPQFLICSLTGDATAATDLPAALELAAGDECTAAAQSGDAALCALSALQRRGMLKATASDAGAENSAARADDEDTLASSGEKSKAWTWSKGPPEFGMAYNGIAWDDMIVSDSKEKTHILAIGDWGGMDGSFLPDEGRPQIVLYPGGASPGPHIFPRSRMHCPHKVFVDCYWPGKQCDPECGFAPGVDDNTQLLVAKHFKARAAKVSPEYILNVGDNFYWGGIEKSCGSPMGIIHPTTQHQFNQVFEGVYDGPGLTGKKWLSVLGNHDWGGRQFYNGWDQQIAYTWASSRWVMPAAYYSQKVSYPDFTIDYFMLDSNFVDAMDPPEDPEHNICSERHNPPDANCSAAGGPPSLSACRSWFATFWQTQKQWVEQKLAGSKTDWQVIVTHFPCGFEADWFKGLNSRLGLDLLVTGHRHDQELWKSGQIGYSGILGGLTCFVTGGGGGITSEESVLPGARSHNWDNVKTQYGFFDLTISKSEIFIELIDYRGMVIDNTTVYPK